MDIAEFENLFVLSKPALERFVYFRMPSKSDADDIIQEAAVSAYMNMHAINNPESFKAWILKIAANKCNDFYRKLAKRYEIPLDEITENVVSKNQYGISTKEVVRETLNGLMNKDKQILFLYYFKNKPQAEIAKLLNIPVGTVKSRLHTAKQNFKQNYPFPPKLKGETQMKTLPDIMPEYKITQSKKAPFEVRCEELMGWSIIPKLGEKLTWAIYDYPERKRSETTKMEVNGRAEVHGIEGVEIIAVEEDPKDFNATDGSRSVERRFVAQLTDTHCRFLAESHVENGVRKYFTFLDGDEFHPNWGFGEDNCGKE
ncbi:MAG: sigma-70 family RNA polymerase sigma factor, partial [Oscillospiraceae bacterium]|nr:sigma-70 family RNA polymerase sigma factor [Oscillospiraceae bacterium]